MKQAKRPLELLETLKRGNVYCRADLVYRSKSVDRDLKNLEVSSKLQKVGPGLYYFPTNSRFGPLPPDEHALLEKFLQTREFLVLPMSLYNRLGLGLTQLYTTVKVYNHKRHATITLANQQYEFKRPNNGFPKHITPEFLLVDLLNCWQDFGESKADILNMAKEKLNSFDQESLLKLANKYGKVATKKFFNRLLNDKFYP